MRWFLRLRVYLIVFSAILLITVAVTFSVLRAVLPHATGYRAEIEQEISELIDLPVEIQTIDAAIHWFSPRLRLLDVSVYDGSRRFPLFTFEEAFLELDVIATLMHGEVIVDDIGLVGTDLSIEKLSDTQWSIQGLRFTSDGSSELPEALSYMLQNSDYLLHDSNIYYRDNTSDLKLNLLDVNIDVSNAFGYHDIKFSMNLPDEYGRYIAIIANLSGDIDEIDGDIFIEAQQVKTDQWNRKFRLQDDYMVDANMDIDLWVEVEDSRIESLVTRLSASDFRVVNNATSQQWQTEYLSTALRYSDDDGDVSINLADFYFGRQDSPTWPVPVNLVAGKSGGDLYLNADFLRVSELRDIVRVFLDGDTLAELADMDKYAVESDIYNLSVSAPDSLLAAKPDEPPAVPSAVEGQESPEQEIMSSDVSQQQEKQSGSVIAELKDQVQLTAALHNLALTVEEHQMAISGLDASLVLDDGVVNIGLSSEDTELVLQNMFRDPLFAESLHGDVTISNDDSGWHISSERLRLKNAHIDTFSRLEIDIPEESVLLDIQTDFYDAKGRYTRRYLPVGMMSAELVEWLDMAITDGLVPDGQFILQGDFDQFPFDEHDGIFQVLFHARDIDLKYLEDWPLLEKTSATVKFENRSLTISDVTATSLAAELRSAYVTIPDLTAPVLSVKTEIHADNRDVQQYIWKSPLDDILGDAMRLFQISGDSKLDLGIEVPLKEGGDELSIDGLLRLRDSMIFYPALGYEVRGINNSIAFTRKSISAGRTNALIQGEKVTIDVITREGKSGSEAVFRIRGDLETDYLLQTYDWVPEDWFSGKSDWSIDVEMPYQPEQYLVHISAESDMQGVDMQISDAVRKDAADRSNVVLEIDVLDDNGMHVDARVSKPLITDEEEIELLSVYAVRDASRSWQFDVDSEVVSGKGSFNESLDETSQVRLNLKYLDLYALLHTEEAEGGRVIDPGEFPPLNWRVKKLDYDDWKLRDVKLQTDWHKHGMLINRLSLSGPSMKFDARGTWLNTQAGGQETVLQGDMSSSQFGETLQGLGFQRSVERGALTANFNARWPAEPYTLSWDRIEGESSFEIEKGEILEVDPGAGGRLLGLLNIFKLTNRLAFDFDDVTRKGFAFDYIKGDFDFRKGAGNLKRFDVSAPAADINMFGSIGLVDRDYGLLMRVKPHTDSLTFAGGTLLGGLAVGAGLALIQKVFDLGVIGHNVYTITGSWDDPEIEKIVERTIDTDEDEDF